MGGETLYTHCCWLNLARLATPFVSNTTSHVWPLFALQVFLEWIWAAWEGFGGWHAPSLMVLCHDLLRGDNKPMHQGNETHSPEMSRIPVPPKKRKRSLLSRKRCSLSQFLSQVSPKMCEMLKIEVPWLKSSQGIENSILVTRLCLGFWLEVTTAPRGCTRKTEEVDGLYALRSFGNSSLGTLCSSAAPSCSIRRSSSQVHNIDKNIQKPHSMVLELQWTWFSPMQYSKL